MERYKDILKNLGASEAEADIFFALLSCDVGATVVQLSQKLNVSRPTVYDRLEQLIKIGIVKKGREEFGAVYFVEQRESLEMLFENRMQVLSQNKTQLQEMFRSYKAVPRYSPRFTVLRSEIAADRLFRDILHSRESEVYWFWPAKEMLHVVSDKVFRYWYTERIKRNIHLKILWPFLQKVDLNKLSILGSPKKEEALREIRVLPHSIDSSMAHCIYGNKVGFLSSTSEQYGFIIDSRELATSFRGQFEYLWKQSKVL